METVADLLSDARERGGTAFSAPERATPMTAEAAVASAYRMGNLFRHYGVRPGERVAVVTGPARPTDEDEPGHLGASPVPVLAVLGALVAGGVVDLDPPGAVDATVLVVPAAWLDRYSGGPGTTGIAYGADPDEADVAHLEREAWSENPTVPPVDLAPTTAALVADRTYAHGDLAAMARRGVAEQDMAAVDRVALSAPLTDAGTILAGVLAPLAAGSTVVLGAGDAPVTVAREATDESRHVDPAATIGGER